MPRRAAAALDLAPLRPRFFFRPASPRHRRPHPPHGVEDELVDVLDHVENAQLMIRVGPQFGQHRRIQV
jgi:hypothetical protein